MSITKEKPVKTISQCGQCGESFDGMVQLKDHIRKVHLPERIAKFNQGTIIDQTPKVKEENLEIKPSEKKITEVQPAMPIIKPEPIILEYRFKGMCPDCRHEPRTILIDIDDYSLAVAFCSNCNKKLIQQKVIPINHQGKQGKK